MPAVYEKVAFELLWENFVKIAKSSGTLHEYPFASGWEAQNRSSKRSVLFVSKSHFTDA